MRKCPYCAEEIQEEAKKCRYCGEWLNSSAPKDTPVEPSQQIPGATTEEIRRLLRNPEVLPCACDKTMEFWLTRISLWGELKITHINSATRTKEKITKERLSKLLTDPSSMKISGRWDAKKLSIKALEMFRNYRDSKGRSCKERILIDIDLKPRIKKSNKGKVLRMQKLAQPKPRNAKLAP